MCNNQFFNCAIVIALLENHNHELDFCHFERP